MNIVDYGKFFGYPECCINYFNSVDYYSLEYIKYCRKSVMYGTGYIPCPKCSKKSKRLLSKIISKNRKCEIKFPKGF